MGIPTKITQKIALALLLVAIALGLFLTWRNSYFKKYIIGLVYVPSSAFHEYVNEILIQKLHEDHDRFQIKTFTASSASFNLIQLNATCNEAIESDADLIICTGIRCAKGMVQMTKRRNSKKPVIFLGILDAVGNELVPSITHPGGHVTGIESNTLGHDLFNPIDLLFIVKPNVTKILLPYFASAEGTESITRLIEEKCKHYGISITLLPIDDINEVLPKTAGLISYYDTLMYIEGDVVSVCGPGLGKLASQHNVTMFAGSIDGIKDSALSYAADPACLADNAFEITKDILINKKNPGDIPVQQATVARNLIINTRLCKEQDLADIDIQKTINTIHHDERFALVRNHIIVN